MMVHRIRIGIMRPHDDAIGRKTFIEDRIVKSVIMGFNPGMTDVIMLKFQL